LLKICPNLLRRVTHRLSVSTIFSRDKEGVLAAPHCEEYHAPNCGGIKHLFVSNLDLEERETKMPSKSNVRQSVESEAASAPQAEALNTSAADSARLDEIRLRAYEIFMERGGQHGHDVEDWLQAERELEPKAWSAHIGP
jgi:hypothetical protein